MKELILLPLYRLIHCWERRLGTAMRRTMLPPWKIVEALSENPELIGKSRYDLRRIGNLIDPEYWFWLLARHPQFTEYFDWFSHRNDSGLNWSELLSRQPGFADKCNWEAVSRLEIIYQELINSTPPAPRTSGLMARVGKLWGKREDTKHTPVRGLYMWGGVGRGKTWLMDLFYQSLPGERKQRLHFHRFMLRVHEELTALQGQTDPLEIIADRFKAETDVLCFDEFFVSDITDAMLLGGLMKALFQPQKYVLLNLHSSPQCS